MKFSQFLLQLAALTTHKCARLVSFLRQLATRATHKCSPGIIYALAIDNDKSAAVRQPRTTKVRSEQQQPQQ